MSPLDICISNCFLMISSTLGRFGRRSDSLFCVLAVLICAVLDGWRTWPLLTIWTLGCSARLLNGDRQVLTDCSLLAGVYAWLLRRKILHLVVKRWSEVSTIFDTAGLSSLHLTLGVATVLAAALIGFSSPSTDGRSEPPAELPPTARAWAINHPPSRIFPCRTTHARVFPKRHAFGYSYLQCGFPVVPEATTAGGMDVSSGKDQKLGRWWMYVNAEDYLDRGRGALGFYGKLKMYLRQQVSMISPDPRMVRKQLSGHHTDK